MASKNTLNKSGLEALGAEGLAELLIELGTGNADVKRRIRLEVASAQSPDEVAKQIRKWLATIAGSTLTHRRTEAGRQQIGLA